MRHPRLRAAFRITLIISVTLIACIAFIVFSLTDPKKNPQVIALFANGVRDAIDHADHFEFLSIDPSDAADDVPPLHNDPKAFHGYPVLGRFEPDSATRATLIASLEKVIAADYANIDAVSCFWPRHGLHIVRDQHTVDVVICFECHHVRFYYGGKLRSTNIDNKSTPDLFNQILRDHHIPLPAQP